MFTSTRTFREMLVCTPVIFNHFLIGMGWGWMAPMLAKLQSPNAELLVNGEQASWLASIHEMGRVAGPFISPLIVDRFGRKYSVILVTTLLFFIWPSQIYLRNVTLLCAVRLLFGVINGVSDVVLAVYITENCSPHFRAVLGPLISAVLATGSALELVIATYLTYTSTAVVNAAISACAFSTLYFCMETPSFLILKGRYDKAECNLSWLRGEDGGVCVGGAQDLRNELEKLKSSVQQEKLKQESLRALFTSTVNVKSLFIVLSIYILGSASGGNTIGTYSVIIFQPSSRLSSYHFTILSGMMHTIAVCASPLTVSLVSRRRLLVIGFALIALNHLCIWLLIHVHSRNYLIPFYSWSVFASVTLCNCLIPMVIPGMFVVRLEILPLSVRAIGTSMAVVVNSVIGFAASKAFQPITSTFGMETNFLIYAAMCMACSIFVYFVMPETQGKTTDEIREILEGKPAGSQMKKNSNPI